MSLPYSPSRAVYEGNGTATMFPFAFKVWSASQLEVGVTSPHGSTIRAQGWTASIGEAGGTVTYLHQGKPLPDGWKIAIVRNMPFTQNIDLVSASRFDPQVIEDSLDQATAERQQLAEILQRSVILPATSQQSPEEVVQSIYASRDAAAASANAAEAAQTAAAASAVEAAASAANAAQTVQAATAEAVSITTAKADAAAASAADARTSAERAEAIAGEASESTLGGVHLATAAMAEAGTEAGAYAMTPLRVAQAAAKAIQDNQRTLPVAGKAPVADTSGRLASGWVVDVGDYAFSHRASKEGYLPCLGAVVSRTTYAALFSVIGTTFGAGDGKTTFSLPNFWGRVPQGWGPYAGAYINAGLPEIVGEWGGLIDISVAGAAAPSQWFGSRVGTAAGYIAAQIVFAASRYNAIYGSSGTVQPPALAVNVFIKY